jgi:proteasome lid subunit RPN8/RPN11
MKHFLLQIPQPIYDEMTAQALAELPAECCGMLAGHISEDGSIGLVAQRYPLVNALASPTEFISEPKSMFAAENDRRQKGLEFLAVYHSHPSSAPIPSVRDLERNFSEMVMNLIIGLVDREPMVLGWWLKNDEYSEADWETI